MKKKNDFDKKPHEKRKIHVIYNFTKMLKNKSYFKNRHVTQNNTDILRKLYIILNLYDLKDKLQEM